LTQSSEPFHPRFRNALEKFLKNLLEDLGEGVEVYVFGSLARGDYLVDSDIDLIVVTDALKEMKPWERAAYLRKLAPHDVGFDIICYAVGEFQEARHRWPDLVRLT